MALHNSVGKWGEDIACDKLIKDGYAILERNWRLHHYEVDIIASKGNRVVFVEVKTRSDKTVDPFEAVDKRKVRHLISSATVYMRNFAPRFEPQFDVIGITGTPDDYELEHIEDAFMPPLRTY